MKTAKFKINDAKLHVSIVVSSTIWNVNLTTQLSEGFKRSVYMRSYLKQAEKVT